MTWRVMATNSSNLSVTIGGQEYTVAVGAVIDVPDADVSAFSAAGYTLVAQSGATADRPPAPGHSLFYDLTLSALIVSDGVVWRTLNGTPA